MQKQGHTSRLPLFLLSFTLEAISYVESFRIYLFLIRSMLRMINLGSVGMHDGRSQSHWLYIYGINAHFLELEGPALLLLLLLLLLPGWVQSIRQWHPSLYTHGRKPLSL